jgi:hypothetical protein
MIESSEEQLRTVPARECRVCLGEHDEDIHSATLDVHAWFRGRVTRYFAEEDVEKKCVA